MIRCPEKEQEMLLILELQKESMLRQHLSQKNTSVHVDARLKFLNSTSDVRSRVPLIIFCLQGMNDDQERAVQGESSSVAVFVNPFVYYTFRSSLITI